MTAQPLTPPNAEEAPQPAEAVPHLFANLRDLFRRSLAARFIAIAAISAAGLMLVGWIALAAFNQQLLRILIDPEIQSVSNNLIGNAGPGLQGEITLQDLPYDPRYLQPLSGRYFQIAKLRGVRAPEVQVISPSLFDTTIQISPELLSRIAGARAASGPQFFDIEGPDREPLRVIAQTAEIPNVEGRYLFLVGVAPRAILAPAANLAGYAFAAFVVFCVLMVVAVAALQVRIGLEPLRDLRRDIAAVRRGNAERLTGEYPAELGPVAEEMNALVDHNREVVERARRHVGNLAHALKTPIAVLKNAAADGEAGDDVLKTSIEEMEGFVERQLRRARVAARAEARAGAQASTIGYRTPVKQNLEDLVFMMEQKYDHQKAIDISLSAENDVTFRGEREDLLEMAANLIDNACKYGRSTVLVTLAPPAAPGGLMEIIVEDDGPGLSDSDIAKVMARGARLDEAAPGQGLGLSILQETVELYAGELQFGRSDLGGLKARLRLPATD